MAYHTPVQKMSISVFREIFKECSVFSKKIYTILTEHEDGLAKNRRRPSSSMSFAPMDRSKRRKKNVKEGPKRPLSSYMIFVREERPGIVSKHPNAKFTEIGKILGDRWAKLSDAEKKKYQDLANQDKVRYNDELTSMNQQHQLQLHGHHPPPPVNPHAHHQLQQLPLPQIPHHHQQQQHHNPPPPQHHLPPEPPHDAMHHNHHQPPDQDTSSEESDDDDIKKNKDDK